jgi:hypothetical protein
MAEYALGADQVGVITQKSNASLDSQSAFVGKAKNLASVGESVGGVNFGPASRAQYTSIQNLAAAGATGASSTAEYDVKKAMAEKNIVQGHEESLQLHKVSASTTDSTFGSLNRPL